MGVPRECGLPFGFLFSVNFPPRMQATPPFRRFAAAYRTPTAADANPDQFCTHYTSRPLKLAQDDV